MKKTPAPTSLRDFPVSMTMPQVAQALGVGLSTVREMHKRRELPVVEVSQNQHRVFKFALMRWMVGRLVRTEQGWIAVSVPPVEVDRADEGARSAA